MDEFAFELALCAHLEEATEWVLARQLGGGVAAPGGRIVDVCAVEPGPEFAERAVITDDEIPALAVESDAGVGGAVFWKDAFAPLDCGPETARAAVEGALDAGFFEVERRGGREYVRQATRYPDWIGRLVAVENKPDLGDPGALERQLRTDASLALFDAVVLATGSYVTRAHLNRIPEEVGVWRFDPESGTREIVRDPTPLPADETGVEPVDRNPLRTDVELVSASEKARARRRIAERAYGKGWRTYRPPTCTNARTTPDGRPFCEQFGRVVDPACDCGTACSERAPGDPPTVDAAALRDGRTPWVRNPPGVRRRQADLDRFTDGD